MKRFLAVMILAVTVLLPNSICAQNRQNRTPNFSGSKSRNILPFRKRPNKEQKKQLEAKAADLAIYSQFLAQPNTGIFRLLPDAGCEENALVLKADENCLNAIPESSFYSFREKEHTNEVVADIRLKNNLLISDGVLAHGIMVNLGSIPLDKVLINSEGLPYLRNYQPQQLSQEAQKQHKQLTQGIKVGKYQYGRIQTVEENATYALRVIAYKGSILRSFRGFHYNLLEGDNRIDLTLAFRVIRTESDGSITLLWKELERRESPKVKFSRKKTN